MNEIMLKNIYLSCQICFFFSLLGYGFIDGVCIKCVQAAYNISYYGRNCFAGARVLIGVPNFFC